MFILLVLTSVENLLLTYRIPKKVTGLFRGRYCLYENLGMELGIDLKQGRFQCQIYVS